MNDERTKQGAIYKAWQAPAQWFVAAQVLAASAEVLVAAADALTPAYDRAYRVALAELDRGAAEAEVKAMRPRYLPPVLLYAYAIENLLKGLLAAKRPDAMGEQTSEAFKGHVSSNFARRAGFAPDDGQARLLDRLHSVVRWIGRYPVALKVGEHGNVYAGRDDAIDPPKDIPAIRLLYGVLFDALKAQIPYEMPGHDIVVKVGDQEHVRVDT
jgi:hypothetical protein